VVLIEYFAHNFPFYGFQPLSESLILAILGHAFTINVKISEIDHLLDIKLPIEVR